MCGECVIWLLLIKNGVFYYAAEPFRDLVTIDQSYQFSRFP